jgi:hypothetical protein
VPVDGLATEIKKALDLRAVADLDANKTPVAAVEWPVFSGPRLVPRQARKHEDCQLDD